MSVKYPLVLSGGTMSASILSKALYFTFNFQKNQDYQEKFQSLRNFGVWKMVYCFSTNREHGKLE